MRKVLFRADGSAEIGLGHVIRSLALAEMLKDDFYCVFAIQEPSEVLYQQISAVCSEVIVLPKVDNKDRLEEELDPYLKGNEVVVLDGYHFATDYQRKIKGKGCMLVCIDDIHAYHFVADVVINHGIDNDLGYSKEAYTKMLLGTGYSLLRQPFLQQIEASFVPKEENNIFLCFGGSDLKNLTCTYLERLVRMDELGIIHVVVGSAFQHEVALQKMLQQNKKAVIKIHRNICAKELVSVIQNCKAAIVPGSTIALECASVGIGVISGYYVDNQVDIHSMMVKSGMSLSIGDYKEGYQELTHLLKQTLLPPNYERMVQIQKEFFDKKSPVRLLNEFNKLSNSFF